MRVEMNYGQPGNVLAEGTDNRQSNRMVAAQADRTQLLVQQFADLGFNRRKGLLESKFQIARIRVRTLGAEVDAGFRPRVRRKRMKRNANNRRRSRRSTQP